jgi:hypothetical protein
MRECGRHSIVLEAPRRIQPFVLKHELAGAHAHLLGEQVGLLEDGSAFADGDDVFLGAVEGQQFAEAPDTGEVEPPLDARALGGPAVLEEVEVFWDRELGPVVADVEQRISPGAGDVDVFDGVSGGAGRVDALLKGGVGHGV